MDRGVALRSQVPTPNLDAFFDANPTQPEGSPGVSLLVDQISRGRFMVDCVPSR